MYAVQQVSPIQLKRFPIKCTALDACQFCFCSSVSSVVSFSVLFFALLLFFCSPLCFWLASVPFVFVVFFCFLLFVVCACGCSCPAFVAAVVLFLSLSVAVVFSASAFSDNGFAVDC